MIAVSSLLVLFGYQNCAQQPGADTQMSANDASLVTQSLNQGAIAKLPNVIPGADQGSVSINDQIHNENMNSLSLAFAEAEKTVDVGAGIIRADGICSSQQNGAVLYWKLLDGDAGNLVMDGYSHCELSGFVVQADLEEPLECVKNYKIEAQLGLGRKAILSVKPDCSGI
jgi:hypothetical protein